MTQGPSYLQLRYPLKRAPYVPAAGCASIRRGEHKNIINHGVSGNPAASQEKSDLNCKKSFTLQIEPLYLSQVRKTG